MSAKGMSMPGEREGGEKERKKEKKVISPSSLPKCRDAQTGDVCIEDG